MFLPNYPFGCHSNQLNSAFWTKCVYSVEDYSSNISIKHICNELEIKVSQVDHLSPPHLYHLPGAALAVLPRH